TRQLLQVAGGVRLADLADAGDEPLALGAAVGGVGAGDLDGAERAGRNGDRLVGGVGGPVLGDRLVRGRLAGRGVRVHVADRPGGTGHEVVGRLVNPQIVRRVPVL